MENKKLHENELENVNGGQAVLPLLSSEENVSVPENYVGAANRYAHCRVCGNVLVLPPIGSGAVQCECGAQIKY